MVATHATFLGKRYLFLHWIRGSRTFFHFIPFGEGLTQKNYVLNLVENQKSLPYEEMCKFSSHTKEKLFFIFTTMSTEIYKNCVLNLIEDQKKNLRLCFVVEIYNFFGPLTLFSPSTKCKLQFSCIIKLRGVKAKNKKSIVPKKL